MTGDSQAEPGSLLARLDRPRAPERVRLAVLADPHLAVEGEGTWKVAHRSRELFERAVARTDAVGADLAVLPGDLTGDGHPAAFEAVDEVLADLETPWVAVPGNHDVPKSFDGHESPPVGAFEQRYGPAGGFPFTREVGPVTLLGVNTASAPDETLRSTWGGRVGERDRAWLADTLPDVETPVVVLHHNVATLPENPGGKWGNFPLGDADAVRGILADHEVPLALTAHHHVPALAEHGPTTEVLAPAVCSYPQGMLLVDIGPAGTEVWLVPLADAAEVREARRLATTGKPLAAGVVELVDRRIEALPLADCGPEA
ncbi:metallophosphoesterase family protein [Salinirussus salinus]|uniref:metallophosphoesterase family protein n=1 Tax=Salinirussus salinus TaxID=1198300 RepID=UPI001356DA2D|nr:metallophosphoesterase [Salinirussus salinus]